jgi:hypothetical protein
MKNLLSSSSIPVWQLERSRKIHRACLCIQAALTRGEKITKALRRVSRRYHQRTLKSDPTRRIQLSAQKLRRHLEAWNKNGKVPAAFVLKYRSRPPYIPRPLMIRFVEFCAGNRLASVRAAWQTFSTRGQNARAKEFFVAQVCYCFSAAGFYLMQSKLKIIETAQAEVTQIKFNAIADITDRLRERPPRRRRNLADAFEI